MSDAAFFRKVLIVAGVAFLGVVVWRIYNVLLLAFAAVLLATLLHGLAEFIERHTRMNGKLAYACAIVLVLLLAGGAGYEFGAQVKAQIDVLGQEVPQAFQSLVKWMRQTPWLAPVVRNFGSGGGAAGLFAHIGNFALTALDVVVGVLVLIFGSVYLGAQPSLYHAGLVKLFPKRDHELAAETLRLCAYAMRRWFLGQLVDMALIGLLSGIGLSIIGVPSAFALALLSGLSGFVPYVGAIVSGALAVLVASGVSLKLALWTLVLYVGIHQSEGHLIMPFVHRWAIALPPAVGVFAVVGIGYLFGPLGVLFATPLTVVAFVLVKKLYLQETLGEEAPIDPDAAAR